MNPIVESLGWTLLHSLWQGALIVAALRLAWPRLARASSQARYLVACAALSLFALAPSVTFFLLHRSAPAVPALAMSGSGAIPPAPQDPFAQPNLTGSAPSASGPTEASPAASVAGPVAIAAVNPGASAASGWLGFGHYFRPALPWLVAAWLAGVGFNLIRIAFGWRLVRRMAGGRWEPWPQEIEERVRRLADRLGIRRAIGGGLSLAVSVPTVVGWLRPVILVPPALLAGLSSAQLDALFAHELAHIRRHDFIVNLLQAICGAVFYYHPAIHAINRRIRAERENACDDIAVGVTGDPIAYARALATLEAARAPELALAASGDGELLGRVRRVLALPPASVTSGLPFAAPGGHRVFMQSKTSNGKSGRGRSLAINLVTGAILIVCVALWYRLPGGAKGPAVVAPGPASAVAQARSMDEIETRTFPLSAAALFRLTGPGVDRADAQEMLLPWFERITGKFADLPGSSLALDDGKLVVTQTVRNLDRIRDLLQAYRVSPPQVLVQPIQDPPANPNDTALHSRVFPLNEDAKAQILAAEGSDDSAKAKNFLAGGGVDFVGVPGSAVTFDRPNSVLMVTQTEANLQNARLRLGPAREASLLTIDFQLVDASPDDLSAIDPEKFRTKSGGTGPIGAGISSGTMMLGNFDVAPMVRALAKKSGGGVFDTPPVTVASGEGTFLMVAESWMYQKRPRLPAAIASATAVANADRWSLTARDTRVELPITAEMEADHHTIRLDISQMRMAGLSGWLEYPFSPAGSPGAPIQATDRSPAVFYQPFFSSRFMATTMAAWDGATIIISDLAREAMANPAAAKGGTEPRFIAGDNDRSWPQHGFVAFLTVRANRPANPATAAVTPITPLGTAESAKPVEAGAASGSTVLESRRFPLPHAAVEMMLDYTSPSLPVAADQRGDPFASPSPAAPVKEEPAAAIEPMAKPREYFRSQGVDFADVPGAAISFDGAGIDVTQTPANLKKIRLIAARLGSHTNVSIEAKLVELDSREFAALDLGRYLVGPAAAVQSGTPAKPGPSLPATGNFDVSAMVRAMTQPPVRGSLLAAPVAIVQSGKEFFVMADRELLYPQSHGEPGSRVNPYEPAGLPLGAPRNITVRNLGVHLKGTPTVSDDGRSINLHLDTNYLMATDFAGGTGLGGDPPQVGEPGASPAWPIGDRPIFAAIDHRALGPMDFSIPDGETVAIELPFKEDLGGAPTGTPPLPPRRMLMLLTAHILPGEVIPPTLGLAN